MNIKHIARALLTCDKTKRVLQTEMHPLKTFDVKDMINAARK